MGTTGSFVPFLRVFVRKWRFLRRIERFCGISPANFRFFRLVTSNLLKSAMIYPCVAIPVHFHLTIGRVHPTIYYVIPKRVVLRNFCPLPVRQATSVSIYGCKPG